MEWTHVRPQMVLRQPIDHTNMASLPFDFGSPVIKSIKMSKNIPSDTARSCSKPKKIDQSYLCFWHTSQFRSNSRTCFLSPFQYKSGHLSKRCRGPGMPPIGDAWNTLNISILNSLLPPTTTLPSLLSNPFVGVNREEAAPCASWPSILGRATRWR